MLAIMSAIHSLARLGDTILDQPPAVQLVGALVLIVVVWVWMSGRT